MVWEWSICEHILSHAPHYNPVLYNHKMWKILSHIDLKRLRKKTELHTFWWHQGLWFPWPKSPASGLQSPQWASPLHLPSTALSQCSPLITLTKSQMVHISKWFKYIYKKEKKPEWQANLFLLGSSVECVKNFDIGLDIVLLHDLRLSELCQWNKSCKKTHIKIQIHKMKYINNSKIKVHTNFSFT